VTPWGASFTKYVSAAGSAHGVGIAASPQSTGKNQLPPPPVVVSVVLVVGSTSVVDVSLPLTPGPWVVIDSVVLVVGIAVVVLGSDVTAVTPLTFVVGSSVLVTGSDSLSLKPGLS